MARRERHIAETLEFSGLERRGLDRARHGESVERRVQVEKTAAFGNRRQAAAHRVADARAHRRVFRQFPAVKFGIAAGKIKPSHVVRDLAVPQRTEPDDLSTQRFDEFDVFRVEKTESLVFGYGDSEGGTWRGIARLGRRQIRRACRQFQKSVEVERFFGLMAQRCELSLHIRDFRRRPQPKMAAADFPILVSRQKTESLDARLFGEPLVARIGRCAGAVENHAANSAGLAMPDKALDERRQRMPRACHVDDQHGGRFRLNRHCVRGRFVAHGDAVIKPHRALDH